MTAHILADVMIVGAGPIGLSMTKALEGLGLKIVLIEKQSQDAIANPAFDGREIAITHRTRAFMQDLHQWQLIEPSYVHLLKKAQVYNGASDFALGFDKPATMHGKKINTLGYLISNQNIRQAAYHAISSKLDTQGDKAQEDAVRSFFGSSIISATTNSQYATAVLDNGTTIYAKLIIAADARNSFVRKVLGISADMHDFGRTVMVFGTSHTKSNELTAHEGFYYGKTLAVLPLGEYRSSMVVTIDNSHVADIKAMMRPRLALEMQSWLGGTLGDMQVQTDIFDYPLIGVHARSFFAQRAALVGDAAVGMHPVTAHGYNLGMESVQLLSEQIARAIHNGKDIADARHLRHYSHKHSLKTRAMYHGTNSIVKLYTSENTPAKALRHLGLRVGQGFLPIKKIITNQLTGN